MSFLFQLLLIIMQGYETQPYKVVSSFNEIEIRYYPSVKLVETESVSEENQNFSRLFRYISGANNNNQKIAMTTPEQHALQMLPLDAVWVQAAHPAPAIFHMYSFRTRP